MTRNDTHSTPIPTRWIGPLTICGNAMNDTVRVPLATYESPLWPSTARGAKVAEHCGGVRCTIVDERMARSVLLTAADAGHKITVKAAYSDNAHHAENPVSEASDIAANPPAEQPTVSISGSDIKAVDLSAVSRADSACLSLLFSVLRRNGSRPELRHMPPAVADLAELYEVREWITP